MPDNKNTLRSEYIMGLQKDSNNLMGVLKENTKEFVKNFLNEAIGENFRNLISEAAADDEKIDFTKEEVIDPEATEIETTETESPAIDEPAEDGKEPETDDITPEEPAAADEPEEKKDDEEPEEGEEDSWEDLEQFKDADGEYDLTGMSVDDTIKVLKVMNPEQDGIRIFKKDDDTMVLKDENTETEYVIELNGEKCEGENCDTNECKTECKTECNECGTVECNEDLGYTDNYQDKTAMTTPPNTETADSKTTYTVDKGIPTGTEKPWAHPDKKAEPYNESEEIEVELDDNAEPPVEESTTVGNGSRTKGVKGDTNHSKEDAQRHIHKSYDRLTNESVEITDIKRKANAIFKENKELKSIADNLMKKIQESVLVNASLSNIIKLVLENATNREEKLDIIERFNRVKSIDECKSLYTTINEELKKSHEGINNTILNNNGTLVEHIDNNKKSSLTETTLYQSQSTNAAIDLMKRMERLG